MDEQKPISGTVQGNAPEPEAVFIGEPVPVETPTPRELLPPEVVAILDKKPVPQPVAVPPTLVPPTPAPVAPPVVTPVVAPSPADKPVPPVVVAPIAPPTPPVVVTTPDLVIPVVITKEPTPTPVTPLAPGAEIKPATPISKPTLVAPLATTPPAPVAAPPASPILKKPLSAPLSLNRLRTYKDDIEVAVRSQNLSVAKVFLAEEEHRRRNQAIAEVSEPDSPKNRIYILVAAVLIFLSLGGFVYFRFFHTQKPVGDLRIDLPALVRSDETKIIDATDISIQSLNSQIGSALKSSIVEREVREIVVGQKLDEEVELTEYHRMSPKELLIGIGASPPEGLERALTSEYFLGSYGSRNGPSPIILLTVDDHSVAYAGMLEWEQTLVRDLSGIFPLAWSYISSEPKPTTEEARFRFATTSKITNTSTTTPTSTSTGSSPINPAPVAPKTPAPGSRNKFTDVVIANKDVRVLHSQNLQPLILYSFLDPNTILITNEPLLVSEVFRRLSVDRQLH